MVVTGTTEKQAPLTCLRQIAGNSFRCSVTENVSLRTFGTSGRSRLSLTFNPMTVCASHPWCIMPISKSNCNSRGSDSANFLGSVAFKDGSYLSLRHKESMISSCGVSMVLFQRLPAIALSVTLLLFSNHIGLSMAGGQSRDQWQCFPDHQKHLTIDRGSLDGMEMSLSPVGNMLTSTLDIFLRRRRKHGFLPTFGFPFLPVFESSQF